jgi:peroxiredoxin Q/BCP
MILAGMVVMGLSVVSAAMAQAPSAGPQVGDPAPAFSLPGSDGAVHSLSEFKGKQAVVVAWYPKAFTGG